VVALSQRARRLFLALIVAQALHSIEEYAFRLYDVLAPARWISGAISSDLPLGFAVANGAIVLFGLWCYLARVRRSHPSGRTLAWFWTLLEGANGVGHLGLAARDGGYFPGVATAPVLLGLAIALGTHLSGGAREAGEQPEPR
jgi:hypothetical protein